MNSNLENKVFKKANDDELVFCDWKECPQRGDYIKCYFDLYKDCPIYKKRKSYKRENELEF